MPWLTGLQPINVKSATGSFEPKALPANTCLPSHGYWRHFTPCETCNLLFYDEASLHRHMTDENHYERYCVPCDRFFVNPTGLRTHLHSKKHRGKNVLYPICNAKFATASSTTYHIASGFCLKAPHMNQETLFQAIRASDSRGWVINVPIKIECQNAQLDGANNARINHNWKCHICHGDFETVQSLEEHLDSPAHRREYYHCPNTLCGRRFPTLSGLFSHLESGSCAFMRVENVLDLHRVLLNDVAMGDHMGLTCFKALSSKY
ncbi:zinc finger protein [Penicillium angulare]|uniref:zinc finger protein n=1 Tax=Penicillium angulare TaxID=116970 RepID=UPI002541AA86|nr:zinc finger protein [Penicillium angulare]KAJ5273418.1 zinc finger protein [Penicillium angulare]